MAIEDKNKQARILTPITFKAPHGTVRFTDDSDKPTLIYRAP